MSGFFLGRPRPLLLVPEAAETETGAEIGTGTGTAMGELDIEEPEEPDEEPGIVDKTKPE